MDAPEGSAALVQNLYFAEPSSLVRRKGTSPLGTANLSPNQDLDGLHWYRIASTEYVVSAHNGRLYDWLAGAERTNSSGKLTSGLDAYAAWIDDRMYWGDGTKQNVYDDGTNVTQAMTSTPTTAPTVAVGAATGPTGTYTYKVSFVNDDGAYSAAGPKSASVTVTNQKVNLTAIPTAPAGEDASARKIWRNKNGGTIYYLVTTINDNTTTTYTDSTTDANLGEALRLNLDGETHADLTRFPPAKFLVAHQNRLIGATGQTILISKHREPWFCPVLPDIEDPEDGTRITLQDPGAGAITGLCSHGDKVAAFTGGALYLLITSDQALDYVLHRFTDHGCVAHRTIKSAKDMLIWLASDGVYMAREGQGVVRISDDEINTILATSAANLAKCHSFIWQDRYHLCLPGGTALIFDLKRQQWSRNTNWDWRCSTVSTFSSSALERIWAAATGAARVHQLETGISDNGTAISTVYETKDMDFGQAAREKRLAYVNAKWKVSTGTATVRIYKGTGTTAVQVATKDISVQDETGATISTLNQRCKEQCRSEHHRVRVEHADASATEYRLLQLEVRFSLAT